MLKKNTNKCEGVIREEVRIAVHLLLNRLRTEESKECEFPSSLTSDERAYIHQQAKGLGLRSKSRGKGANRYLTVYKQEGSSIIHADAYFQLVSTSRQHVKKLLFKNRVTNKEQQELLPLTERDRMMNAEVKAVWWCMNGGIPQVPSAKVNQELLPIRQGLPISSMRDTIVNVINSNQVVLICSDTGSGKTTQIPQFILEDCLNAGKTCSVICTQSRRISAVSVSERVAAERDEEIGLSVGYHTGLESRVSPKTILTYCTERVLLRTLMGGDSTLATVTHILVDDIEERSHFSDLLLIILRNSLTKFPSLCLVLMSATADIQLFAKYFNNCPVILVPVHQYDVQEYFLEDVLKRTKYMSSTMNKLKADAEHKKKQQSELEKWISLVTGGDQKEWIPSSEQKAIPTPILGRQTEPVPEKTELEAELVEELDRCISEAWLSGSEDAFAHLVHFIPSVNVSVDYQHSQTSVTVLMVAAGRGSINTVEQLLNLGANLNIRASNEWTALDWARSMKQDDIVELIEAYIKAEPGSYSDFLPVNETGLAEEDKELLDIYYHSFIDDKMDIDLLMTILHEFNSSQDKGAVLVFLSGYDDVLAVRERIVAEEKKLTEGCRFTLYTLHSNMQTGDQKCVFRPAPPGVRKIILSTNIAETSVTIDDVTFVIDTGKVKEESYDAMSGTCMLHQAWISKACSEQRKGRAGRTHPGICYHMFSRRQYRALQRYTTPEILRMPLQELCLHARLLAPVNIPIADFLAQAIEPPQLPVMRNAVQLLKTIDALDSWEGLTELGHHLLNLSVEPRLGKMLLYSVVLKCLNPVLTIVCCLAYRDPFILPRQPSQKRACLSSRKKFSEETYSDHMALLRAFQAWENARGNGREHVFCEKHFVSAATMEMVDGMRLSLLAQLRAFKFVWPGRRGNISDLNRNSENWAVVKAALCAGMYPNLIRVDREHKQLRAEKESNIMFHPSSTLRDCPKSSRTTMAASHSAAVDALPSDWLVYEEISRSGQFCHARCCTVVSPITVALFAGPARMPLDAVSEAETFWGGEAGEVESDSEAEDRPDGQNTTMKLDEWVMFRVDAEAAHLALQLRRKWHSLFLRRMRAPAKPWSKEDEAVLRAAVGVLTAEEQALGLQQPQGISQCPHQTGIDHYPTRARRTPEEEAFHDGIVFMGSTDNRRAFRQRNAYAFRPTRTADHGDQSASRSINSFGSGNMSQTPSPIPSHGSAGDNAALTGSPTAAAVRVDSRYFVIKTGTLKAVEVSLSCGAWAFTCNTEWKLTRAYKEGKQVVLVFSVQGSGHFQGFAHLTGDKPCCTADQCLDMNGPNLNAPLPVKWIKRANIPFQATRHLLNPYDDNRRVQRSRDGQEIEPSIGEALCSLWEMIPPFFPKSTFFDSLKTVQETPETAISSKYVGYHGRPIRGDSHMGYGPGYQSYGGNYGHRGQHPK